jgi:hypothetical protein
VRITFSVGNTGDSRAAFNVDLRIHFVKAHGGTSPKVFRMGALHLEAGAQADVSKLVSLRQHTTRTHYRGVHRLEAIINGEAHPVGSFFID